MKKNRVQVAFGKAMHDYRVSAGLTQERLAELAEIHRTYVGDVERGERNISVVNMAKIAGALKIKLSELVREMEKNLGRERSA